MKVSEWNVLVPISASFYDINIACIRVGVLPSPQTNRRDSIGRKQPKIRWSDEETAILIRFVADNPDVSGSLCYSFKKSYLNVDLSML